MTANQTGPSSAGVRAVLRKLGGAAMVISVALIMSAIFLITSPKDDAKYNADSRSALWGSEFASVTFKFVLTMIGCHINAIHRRHSMGSSSSRSKQMSTRRSMQMPAVVGVGTAGGDDVVMMSPSGPVSTFDAAPADAA